MDVQGIETFVLLPANRLNAGRGGGAGAEKAEATLGDSGESSTRAGPAGLAGQTRGQCENARLTLSELLLGRGV